MATVRARTPRGRPPLRRPTEGEIKQAREAARRLESASARPEADRSSAVRLAIRDEDGAESEVELPPLALTLLGYILGEMAGGNAVDMERVPRLLDIPQAAGLLGVSRLFVINLIDQGELPCQMDGDEQRVVFEDLMAFKKKDDEATSKVLDELVAEAQELGLGY